MIASGTIDDQLIDAACREEINRLRAENAELRALLREAEAFRCSRIYDTDAMWERVREYLREEASR